MSELPVVPYGAVYFRKSNPPREDWARDYRVAAEDGINTFRHWFLWSAIDVTVEIGENWGRFKEARSPWGQGAAAISGRQLTVQVDGRDAAVLELR